jgi:hypothetical protein
LGDFGSNSSSVTVCNIRLTVIAISNNFAMAEEGSAFASAAISKALEDNKKGHSGLSECP